MENEKKYKKCDLGLNRFCGLPCHDITDDGYCTLQPLINDTNKDCNISDPTKTSNKKC